MVNWFSVIKREIEFERDRPLEFDPTTRDHFDPRSKLTEEDGRKVGRIISGTRLRLSEQSGVSGSYIKGVLSPSVRHPRWRLQDMDVSILDSLNPQDLIELLVEVSPDLSRGLWDFLRQTNPGWEVNVFYPNSKRVHSKGQKVITDFLEVLRTRYGSVDVPLNRLYIGAYLRGGFFGEVVLDSSGKNALDFATPDPGSVRFRKKVDPLLGSVWELGQTKLEEFIALDTPTVCYIPIDPLPASPYGRSMATPAIFTILFLQGLMHDLRRVIAQQGYPRIDIEVKLKELLESMPENIQQELSKDVQTFEAWVKGIITEVEEAYQDLNPADAYVHADTIDIKRPVGTIDASSLGAVDGLIRSLERMAARALKTMPLLMGLAEGTSEGNSNRQWEIHVAGIKALQHFCENLLEHLLQQVLRAKGIQAKVVWRFAELRVAEMIRDAQVFGSKLSNADLAYKLGYWTQEQASMYAVGSLPAENEPRVAEVNVPNAVPGSPPGPVDGTEQMEGGANAAELQED